MKRFFAYAAAFSLMLSFVSCASSSGPSPSAEGLNAFSPSAAADYNSPQNGETAGNTFAAGTLPIGSTAGGGAAADASASVQPTGAASASTPTPKPTPAPTPAPAPTPTPAPTLTPAPQPSKTTEPTLSPRPTASYTPEPTTTPVNVPIPTAVIGEPKEHYDDIQGVNGKNNASNYRLAFVSLQIINADNYIYFVGGEPRNQMVPYGTYRLDTRTDKLEFFSGEQMNEMFIAGEWLYYEIYDSETDSYYSYRMHSDGTCQTRLSYLMPDVFCCLDEYLYYIEEGSLYRRLISGEDEPVLAREPEQDEEFSSICTDGRNLYIVSDSADGSRIYKQSGSESKILWTGDNIGAIVYDSGYIWGESHWEENKAYTLLRIDAETGEEEYTGLCEDYSKSVSYNIADGTLYICGTAGFDFNNLISMDVNFENRKDLDYIASAGNLNCIRGGEFCVIGDYFCFKGPVGKGVYESVVLFKNDGSNKYMVIDTDFPDPNEEVPSRDYPIMAWMKDDWMDEYTRP